MAIDIESPGVNADALILALLALLNDVPDAVGPDDAGNNISLVAGRGGVTSGSGGGGFLQGGNARGNDVGGQTKLQAGNGHGTGQGGEANVYGGFGGDEGDGGHAYVTAGDAGSTSGTGGPARLRAGITTHGKGGLVSVVGGQSFDGEGGNVLLQPGSGSGGQTGFLLISGLPEVDPGIADPSLIGQAIWLNNGVLTISAGA